jgi:hypothetical protein
MSDTAKLRESARKIAESISSTVSDDERAQYGVATRLVMEGLRQTVSEGTPEEIAAKLAMSFATLLAMISRSPFQDAHDIVRDTIISYAWAAGALTGTFTLPDAPEGDPALDRMMAQVREATSNGQPVAVVSSSAANNAGDSRSVGYL